MSDKSKKELIEQFVKNAEAAVATVEVIPANASSLNDALLKQVAEDSYILFAPPNDLDPNLFKEFISNEKAISNPDKEQLKFTKTGVTDAFCGIASTGSVCIPAVQNLTSAVTMLTQKHIVVLNGNSIVPKPRDVFSENYLEGKGLKRSFSFITGPSATADMGPLVRGVHGPGKLHILVLE
jgi:L-lactate dehydrogenase complex protein LldG